MRIYNRNKEKNVPPTPLSQLVVGGSIMVWYASTCVYIKHEAVSLRPQDYYTAAAVAAVAAVVTAAAA